MVSQQSPLTNAPRRALRAPHLRLIQGNPFLQRERERVALRVAVHTGEREVRGVATRLDENAIEIFGVARGLTVGDSVVAKIELERGGRPLWLPACAHNVSAEKTLLWFDAPDAKDLARVEGFLNDIRTFGEIRSGLFSYFHDAVTAGPSRVCVLPPA